MPAMSGKMANLRWDADDSDTELQHGQSWVCVLINDVARITAFQDTWDTFAGGFHDWTATVECLIDTAGLDISLGGDDGLCDDVCSLELYMYWDTDDYVCVHGDAICTGAVVEQTADDVVKVTYSFQGTGYLTLHDSAMRP